MCCREFRLLCTDTVHYYLIITVMASVGKKKQTKKSGCPWASHAACGATTGWGLRDGNGGQNQAISGLPRQVFDLPSVRII